MIDEKYVDKLNPVSLSDNIVQWKIAAICKDIKKQTIDEIKSAGYFSIEIDESTVSLCQACSWKQTKERIFMRI